MCLVKTVDQNDGMWGRSPRGEGLPGPWRCGRRKGGGEEGAWAESPLLDLQEAAAETQFQTHDERPFICPNSGTRDGTPGRSRSLCGRRDGVLGQALLRSGFPREAFPGPSVSLSLPPRSHCPKCHHAFSAPTLSSFLKCCLSPTRAPGLHGAVLVRLPHPLAWSAGMVLEQ